eukprot:scaffold34604_cov164-Amphora_coffeaeformis.AAC.10
MATTAFVALAPTPGRNSNGASRRLLSSDQCQGFSIRCPLAACGCTRSTIEIIPYYGVNCSANYRRSSLYDRF